MRRRDQHWGASAGARLRAGRVALIVDTGPLVALRTTCRVRRSFRSRGRAWYRDLPLGPVDATVIAATEILGVPKVATLDHRHFSVVRPAHTKALAILPRGECRVGLARRGVVSNAPAARDRPPQAERGRRHRLLAAAEIEGRQASVR